METIPYPYNPPINIDWSSVNVIQPAYAQVLTETVKQPGIMDNIWSWLMSSPLNWAMVIFSIIMAIQVYLNSKNESSYLRKSTAFGMFIMSIWGIWMNYNHWIGGILAFLSLWLLVQSTKYKDEFVEDEEEAQPEPVKQSVQRQIPTAIPVRPIPQPHAFDGFSAPSMRIWNL